MQLENKSQEYMAKFKSIESSYQVQMQERDASNRNLEVNTLFEFRIVSNKP